MPTDNFVDDDEARTAKALAAKMSVSPDRVRVVLMRDTGRGPSPPGSRERAPSGSSPREQRPDATRRNADTPNLLVGRFEAGLRLADGRWRVLSPAISRIDVWHLEALAWLIGILLAVAPIAWFFARRLSAPIAAFASAAERLGKDPRGEPITVAGPREIAAAALAFNEMQTRLRRYVDDRTTMVAAIAHDLRTPLMRLALRLQKATPDVRAPSEADIREIEDMVTAALSFVRDFSKPVSRTRMALRALIETVVDDMTDLGRDVELAPGGDATLDADLAGLKRMFVNLTGNAVAYGNAARVSLLIDPQYAVVEIVDRGPGIPEEELDRVFEPFYRLERSRNRETGGTGLGLASARAVARAHGGDVVLKNSPNGGVLAQITLPL